MIVSKAQDVQSVPMTGPGVQNAAKKLLIKPADGWEGYAMRVIYLGVNGSTPRHEHDWPHINYILSGQGELFLDGQTYELTAGGFAYVPGGKTHQFRNLGADDFSFICIVTEDGDPDAAAHCSC